MRLRVKPMRFRTKKGKMKTEWLVEYFDIWMLDWDWLYHHGYKFSFTRKMQLSLSESTTHSRNDTDTLP